jgi:hypothetical protein
VNIVSIISTKEDDMNQESYKYFYKFCNDGTIQRWTPYRRLIKFEGNGVNKRLAVCGETTEYNYRLESDGDFDKSMDRKPLMLGIQYKIEEVTGDYII